jgi:hypothetical protein
MKSVLQDWVMELGLRHQGVLLTAVRGCDVSVKDDPSKRFVRVYRGLILNAHVGDAKKSASFIEYADVEEMYRRFEHLRKQKWDQLPFHYAMHLIQATEIVGFKHPTESVRVAWDYFYESFCRAMHVNPETEAQLDFRLNADEHVFKEMQQ